MSTHIRGMTIPEKGPGTILLPSRCGCSVDGIGTLQNPWRPVLCKLHAAAPALAEALRNCVEVLAVMYNTRQRNNGAGQQAYDKARAALALLDGNE